MIDRVEINLAFLSGTISSDLDVRRPGTNRHPIVSFDVETHQVVGKNKRPEVLRWRGKCFGTMAEQAMKELRKGIRVFAEGSFSAYDPPNRKRAPLIEITVKRFWTNLPMEISADTSFGETSPEDREAQLKKDLES